MDDSTEKSIVHHRYMGKFSSIDLVREVVQVLLDIIDQLGNYIYSDERTYKVIPQLLETILQFVHGPCIENQMFLGKWRLFLDALNFLLEQKELGNYSSFQHEALA